MDSNDQSNEIPQSYVFYDMWGRKLVVAYAWTHNTVGIEFPDGVLTCKYYWLLAFDDYLLRR
ncbi:MAG: hypothetical protein ACI8RD_003418 [Bacillariaceae sp.]|jgi:hypothetical protein